MIERFHRSLKSALRSQLAGSDWFLHLPLVLLPLRTVPKDDTGLSGSEAVYGSSLTVPGEFLGSPELPPALFLRKIEDTFAGFAAPPPHHVRSFPPQQLLPAFLAANFVFVQEDSSIPSLAPLYWGPYLVLEGKDKYFHLQLGSRTDVVSVDRLNPAFLEDPIQNALPSASRSAWSLDCLARSGSAAFFNNPGRRSCSRFCLEDCQIPASVSCTYLAEPSSDGL